VLAAEENTSKLHREERFAMQTYSVEVTAYDAGMQRNSAMCPSGGGVLAMRMLVAALPCLRRGIPGAGEQ